MPLIVVSISIAFMFLGFRDLYRVVHEKQTNISFHRIGAYLVCIVLIPLLLVGIFTNNAMIYLFSLLLDGLFVYLWRIRKKSEKSRAERKAIEKMSKRVSVDEKGRIAEDKPSSVVENTVKRETKELLAKKALDEKEDPYEPPEKIETFADIIETIDCHGRNIKRQVLDTVDGIRKVTMDFFTETDPDKQAELILAFKCNSNYTLKHKLESSVLYSDHVNTTDKEVTVLIYIKAEQIVEVTVSMLKNSKDAIPSICKHIFDNCGSMEAVVYVVLSENERVTIDTLTTLEYIDRVSNFKPITERTIDFITKFSDGSPYERVSSVGMFESILSITKAEQLPRADDGHFRLPIKSLAMDSIELSDTNYMTFYRTSKGGRDTSGKQHEKFSGDAVTEVYLELSSLYDEIQLTLKSRSDVDFYCYAVGQNNHVITCYIHVCDSNETDIVLQIAANYLVKFFCAYKFEINAVPTRMPDTSVPIQVKRNPGKAGMFKCGTSVLTHDIVELLFKKTEEVDNKIYFSDCPEIGVYVEYRNRRPFMDDYFQYDKNKTLLSGDDIRKSLKSILGTDEQIRMKFRNNILVVYAGTGVYLNRVGFVLEDELIFDRLYQEETTLNDVILSLINRMSLNQCSIYFEPTHYLLTSRNQRKG